MLYEKPKILKELEEIGPTLFEEFRFAHTLYSTQDKEGWTKIKGKGEKRYKTIFWTNRIAICDNTAKAGAVWPYHQHPSMETFIIYQGEMHLYIDRNCYVLDKTTQPFSFDARQKHGAAFEKDSGWIAITVPADKDWKPKK